MFVFLFSLCKKKRDSACICVLIKELLLMFVEVMIFLNGFASVMIFLIGGLDFKLAAWVSDQWLGWWVWWPLLAPTGLMVCICVALLMV